MHSLAASEPPPAVTAALARACSLVERDGGGWRVGGEPAVAGVDGLADALYDRWYTAAPGPAPPVADDPPLRRRSLLSALRAAHVGAGGTEPGWTVAACDPGGRVSAAKGDGARALRPGEYRMPLRPGVPAAPGEPVEPLARLDGFDAERETWWALAERPPEQPRGRVYLNARPATAARAIHEVTAALDGATYMLKCPALAAVCARVDTIVVYHERDAREQLLARLAARWARLGPLLDPAVPPLTREVRAGLAWADDVEGERSFGESRCEALAAAIDGAAAAWEEADEERRLELLRRGLRAAGIDPARPWEAGG